jgi:hypothetical protein
MDCVRSPSGAAALCCLQACLGRAGQTTEPQRKRRLHLLLVPYFR